MSVKPYALEPFPKFVDSSDSGKAGHFSMMGAALQLLSGSGAVQLRRKQDNLTRQVTDYINLQYYQYEVTLGLYVMTTMEKLICNTIILGILTTLTYGLYYGLQPFIVKSICQVLYYITGSLAGIEDICPDPTCT